MSTMQLAFSKTIVLMLLACVVQGNRIKKEAQNVDIQKVATATDKGVAQVSAAEDSAHTDEEEGTKWEHRRRVVHGPQGNYQGNLDHHDQYGNHGHHDHHGRHHDRHDYHGNQGHRNHHDYHGNHGVNRGWNNHGHNNGNHGVNRGWNNHGHNNNGWNHGGHHGNHGGHHNYHGGHHGNHGVLHNLFSGKKKHEVCCMCERHVGRGKTEWFPGEDYTVGQNAQGRCNRECAAKCRRKGADFAGCWREARMKTLRREARSHPLWTIKGMPDDWFGDHPNDIC